MLVSPVILRQGQVAGVGLPAIAMPLFTNLKKLTFVDGTMTTDHAGANVTTEYLCALTTLRPSLQHIEVVETVDLPWATFITHQRRIMAEYLEKWAGAFGRSALRTSSGTLMAGRRRCSCCAREFGPGPEDRAGQLRDGNQPGAYDGQPGLRRLALASTHAALGDQRNDKPTRPQSWMSWAHLKQIEVPARYPTWDRSLTMRGQYLNDLLGTPQSSRAVSEHKDMVGLNISYFY